MRNTYVFLLLGLLLAREGVQGSRLCYSCSDCAELEPSEKTKTCGGSCMAVITCQGTNTPDIQRVCSLTNENAGCVASTAADTHHCFCNSDKCDAYAENPDVCNSTFSTAASLAVVLLTLVSAFLLK